MRSMILTTSSRSSASATATAAAMIWSLSLVRGAHLVAHPISSTKYTPIPSHLTLINVVVIHRHGDRSQISRSIGENFPETADIVDVWDAKMPTEETMKMMAASAALPEYVTDKRDLKSSIYYGYDAKNSPFGQLTDLGSQQLRLIGKEFRRRYVGNLLSTDIEMASSEIFARSTHFCRTLQSTRCLLSGLLDLDASHHDYYIRQQETDNRSSLPTIVCRPKDQETMFPTADGACEAMTERRAEIFANDLMAKSVPNYHVLEARMKKILGYPGKVSWVTVKEILTCYEAHGIPFPPGVTDEDADQITVLCGWMWGTIYQDDRLNRLAIGRFLRELLNTMRTSVFREMHHDSSETETTCRTPAKLMLFSGHDSTLVPVLCALGIYDGVWPPYASYLSLEVAENKTNPEAKFVRAIYNDDEKMIIGSDSVWCPYEVFSARLESLALTQDQYKAGCQELSNKSRGSEEAELSDDIKATMVEIKE